jgi:hypothetical protein
MSSPPRAPNVPTEIHSNGAPSRPAAQATPEGPPESFPNFTGWPSTRPEAPAASADPGADTWAPPDVPDTPPTPIAPAAQVPARPDGANGWGDHDEPPGRRAAALLPDLIEPPRRREPAEPGPGQPRGRWQAPIDLPSRPARDRGAGDDPRSMGQDESGRRAAEAAARRRLERQLPAGMRIPPDVPDWADEDYVEERGTYEPPERRRG